MYNVYVKRKIFIITKIVHMNTGVNSEKEKVKESQSRRVAPLLDTHFGCRVGGVTVTPANPRKLHTSMTFLDGFHSIITSIFLGSTRIPSSDTRCPRKDTSLNQNSHFLNFAYNLSFSRFLALPEGAYHDFPDPLNTQGCRL